MNQRRYRIRLTTPAREHLAAIRDLRIQREIAAAIERLAGDPEKIGRALVGELVGYRSLRVAGQRYRVIYKVLRDEVIVVVVAMGLRREGDRADVYELARKLIRLRLLE